jgi:ATP-dependent DNA helicase RecQ
MPTGGGKSICFQIPALVLDGTTIVISPLIALMKDQVDGLKANGISAEYLNSSLDFAEQAEITERLLAGEIKILYVSAEKLVSPEFMVLLKKIKPNLFAIDEAHCISAWGHDFRPDYTKLSCLKTTFPKVPIIALTATADESTRKDILSQLELDNAKEFVDSFDRPNISLTVLPGQKRIEKIKDFLSDKGKQSGIIYCLTRKQTENLAEKIKQMGMSVACYHAGLSSVARSKIQTNFITDKTQIICATIAFGMGIDKLNVRWVIHYNTPKNIEGYYQEIGRAGRDGAPAEALLFYTFADIEMIKKFFVEESQGGVQLAKLDRMKEYAEAVICRRKILLDYFDENYAGECNNCDICANPFQKLNGTKIAKKVLEEVVNGKYTTKQLVSVLMQYSNKISFASWHFYIAQLKNLGIIKQDFQQNQILCITNDGKSVTENKLRVELVMLEEFIKRQEQASKTKKSYVKKKTSQKEYYKNPLFEKLRELRTKIAKESNVPAYVVFSDKTLLEMANEKPSSKDEMLQISGVGEVKWEKYGEVFLEVMGEKGDF